MTNAIYRYQFDSAISSEDVEASLVLAILATECLHGEAQVRLDASHCFDAVTRTCVIDAKTTVGRDFNRLFVGFLRREFGEDSFRVERLGAPAAAVAA